MTEAQAKLKQTRGPNGGARPGAGKQRGNSGRRVGTVSERAKALRKVSDKDLFDGVVPLSVMLKNMRHHFAKAEELSERLIEQIEGLAGQASVDDIKQILSDYGRMLTYREQAQTCAVDAAPYCHPRLSAIHVSGSVTKRVELAGDVTPQDALERFKQNLRTRPMAIEHQPSAEGRESA